MFERCEKTPELLFIIQFRDSVRRRTGTEGADVIWSIESSDKSETIEAGLAVQ